MKRLSRIIAGVMLIAAIGFLWFALHHPECNWPWNNTVSYVIYGIYVLVMVGLLIASFHKRN